ncbi:MAG: glycosyltransferase family 4 protein [Chloroflexi bacterium]|nr:glycosyltransferase family 4 protein [Chloroflexota bacterium]
MNVLMIGLSDRILSGWGDVAERHIEYADRLDHLHMIVYSPRANGYRQTALSDRLTVYPTRSAARPAFLPDALRIGVRIAREHPIDLITTQGPHTSGLIGVWLKRRLGVPLDIQNHSDFFDNRHWIAEKPLRYALFNRLGKWVIRRGDTHRVLNETEKAKYVAMGIDPARIAVLATPVRLGRFQPDPAAGVALRQRMGIPLGCPVLLWVGRPGPVKRVTTLLEAFALLRATHPEAHLVLVGDFATYEPERIEQGAPLGVHFPGPVEHAELPAYYTMADLYVHSSIYEGLGKVLIEAAACGTPAVSTATAGAQQIIADGETGLLCAIEDPADMAAKIAGLLADPARRARMGAAARAHVLAVYDHARNLDAVVATWARTLELAG